jgi:hypothetical protein
MEHLRIELDVKEPFSLRLTHALRSPGEDLAPFFLLQDSLVASARGLGELGTRLGRVSDRRERRGQHDA